MVAYNFKTYFAPQILDLSKTHTIRGHRRWHAQVGEPVQLFTGMRSKHCRKIIADPVCVAVRPVRIMFSELIDEGIASIEISGRQLGRNEIEAFAVSDGFLPERLSGLAPDRLIAATARETMSRFWATENPGPVFEGVMIEWRPGQ